MSRAIIRVGTDVATGVAGSGSVNRTVINAGTGAATNVVETAGQRGLTTGASSGANLSADIGSNFTSTAGQRAGADAAGTAGQRVTVDLGGDVAGTGSQRAGRGAAGDAAETTAQRTGKDAATKTSYSTIAGYAAVAGMSAYVYTQMKDEDEAIRDCVSACLPTNYDAYMYEDLDKSELEYSPLEPTTDQPVCKEETEGECGDHCLNTCEDIHETSLFEKMGPLGDVAAEVVDEAGDVAEDVTTDIFETLGLTGPDGLFTKFGKAMKIGGIICLFLCLVYILFMVF